MYSNLKYKYIYEYIVDVKICYIYDTILYEIIQSSYDHVSIYVEIYHI
jgi:hypothetical protein